MKNYKSFLEGSAFDRISKKLNVKPEFKETIKTMNPKSQKSNFMKRYFGSDVEKIEVAEFDYLTELNKFFERDWDKHKIEYLTTKKNPVEVTISNGNEYITGYKSKDEVNIIFNPGYIILENSDEHKFEQSDENKRLFRVIDRTLTEIKNLHDKLKQYPLERLKRMTDELKLKKTSKFDILKSKSENIVKKVFNKTENKPVRKNSLVKRF